MSEALLGFDTRIVGLDADVSWIGERRRRHLLRDVPRPLSVDIMVWPTVFEPNDQIQKRQPWNVGWVPRPDWIGPNDSWENLADMEKALAGAKAPPQNTELWKVAISWHDTGELRPGLCGPYVEPMLPPTRSDSWTLLGFDVADPSISGLSNCGYEDREREMFGQRWSDCLNDHHLLTNIDDAMAFREFTNQRVPEHAPFFVLGLWRIP